MAKSGDAGGGKGARPYDYFISYCRRDLPWVIEHLYLPMRARRLRDGREPRVFFDKDAIESGHAWRQSLADGIERCRHFVAVYSEHYFRSDFCQWELDLAATRDPLAKQGIVMPVKVDECEVPFAYGSIHYTEASSRDWSERLFDRLGLDPGEDESPAAAGTHQRLTDSYLFRDLLDELRALTDSGPSAFEARLEVYGCHDSPPLRATRDIALIPRRTQTAFSLGDTLQLRVSVNEDCYVYVLNIGTSGKVTLLFPNRFTPDNRARSGASVTLPAQSDPYDLTVTGKPGREIVQVFALDRPIDDARDAEPLPDSFEPIALPRLTRDIQIIAHAARRAEAPVRAAFAQVEFDVEARR